MHYYRIFNKYVLLYYVYLRSGRLWIERHALVSHSPQQCCGAMVSCLLILRVCGFSAH